MHLTQDPSGRAGGLGLANRRSAATQALVSAALLLPTAVIWYLRTLPWEWDWDGAVVGYYSLAWTLVLDVYFVVVVAVLARNARCRVPAMLTAVVATVVDFGANAVLTFASYSQPVVWLDRVCTVVALTLFVCAWGMARRRRPTWMIGLAPTLVVMVLLTALYASSFLYDTFGNTWVVYWAVWVGAFVLGCLFCWGFDQIGSAPAPDTQRAAPAHPPAYPSGAPTNAMAIAALVASLVFAPLGIVFGHLALNQLKRTGEEGRGLAIAGLAIGYVATGLMVFSIVVVGIYLAWLGAVLGGTP